MGSQPHKLVAFAQSKNRVRCDKEAVSFLLSQLL